jgi:hypothetical protein
MTEIVERVTRIEPDWSDVERRSRRLHKHGIVRRALLTAGVVAAAAALAAGAYAAVRAWTGHDMTPADVERQATTVTNACDGNGRCTAIPNPHREVTILPSMGVVFVLPDGDSTPVIPTESIWNIPAAGMPTPPGHPMRDDSGNSWGTAHPLRDSSGNWIGGVWKVPLPGGGERTITWHQATGAVTIADEVDGSTTVTKLHTGDVVPLIPGTLTDDPRTLDKAVTFDLPPGERVIIFPRLNETYIDFVHGPVQWEPLAYGEAAKYGLTPIGHHDGKLPVTASGGTWTSHLPGGLTRTVGWRAGDSFVTVEDATSTGTTTTEIPIGHEIPLVPFKQRGRKSRSP